MSETDSRHNDGRSRDTARTVMKIVMIVLICLAAVLGKLLWDQKDTAATGSFEDLIAANPEVIAWLTVDGTGIDTVVVQSDNNTKYLNTDVYGEQSLTGTPFLDYRNAAGFSDCYSIIYGHNVENRKMFSDLNLFTDEEFWEDAGTGTLELRDGTKMDIEFFACIRAKGTDSRYFDPRMVRNNWNEDFLKELTEKAIVRKGDIGTGDRVLVLSTCEEADSEDRILLMGRLI